MVLPCSHSTQLARALDYEEDTPIKGLKSNQRDEKQTVNERLSNKIINVSYRPANS